MSNVPRSVHHFEEFPNITLVIYGVKFALSAVEDIQQGFYITLDNVPVSRATLKEKNPKALEAVKSYLYREWPEHSKLL